MTTPPARPAPKWLSWTGLGLCLLGLGIAAYLTYEHFTGSKSLSCPASGGIVNCFAVTTSKYSYLHGIPVSVLGLVFFFVMAAFQLPWAWSTRLWPVRWGRIGWSLVGVGTAVWLVYAELFRIHNICLWCTAVHAVSLVLFVVIMFGTAVTTDWYDDEDDEDPLSIGAASGGTAT